MGLEFVDIRLPIINMLKKHDHFNLVISKNVMDQDSVVFMTPIHIHTMCKTI